MKNGLLTSITALACVVGLTSCQKDATYFDSATGESIIGGTPVLERKSAAAKSVVMIEMQNILGRTYSLCTATLISPHHVLTAGHCFDKKRLPGFSKFKVHFGLSFNSDSGESRKGLDYKVHTKFNSTQLYYDHDIAVASFEGTLPDGFAPVAYDTNRNADYSNATLYVYGYGRTVDYTDQPNQFPGQYTGRLYRGIMQADGRYVSRFADRFWTNPSVPQFICQGDSGGPQFYHQDGVLKIIGINSGVFGADLPNGKSGCKATAQITKVAPFATWIKESLKILTTESLETSSEHSNAFVEQALQQ